GSWRTYGRRPVGSWRFAFTARFIFWRCIMTEHAAREKLASMGLHHHRFGISRRSSHSCQPVVATKSSSILPHALGLRSFIGNPALLKMEPRRKRTARREYISIMPSFGRQRPSYAASSRRDLQRRPPTFWLFPTS